MIGIYCIHNRIIIKHMKNTHLSLREIMKIELSEIKIKENLK